MEKMSGGAIGSQVENNNGSLSGTRNARDSGRSKRATRGASKTLDPRNNTTGVPRGYVRGI